MKQIATAALEGVGDKSRQWMEFSGYAYHLRRRLTESEAANIGEAVDIRGTPEAMERFARISDVLPEQGVQMAVEELRGTHVR